MDPVIESSSPVNADPAQRQARLEINSSAATATSRQIRHLFGQSRTFNIKVLKGILRGTLPVGLPESISLKLKGRGGDQVDQLFVDDSPIASQNWTFEHDTATLKFRQQVNGRDLRGNFHLNADKVIGNGLLELDGQPVGAQIHVKPVTYNMKVAAGAAYVSGSSVAPQLNYDPSSNMWKESAWPEDNNMEFTYGIDGSTVIAGQTVYLMKVIFRDLETNETWEPQLSSYTAYLDANYNLQFNLNVGMTPQPDPYNPIARFSSKKFPYIFIGQLSGGYRTFNAAMLSEKRDLDGAAYGCQGTYNPNVHMGLFAVSHESAPKKKQQSLIALANGKLYVGGAAAGGTKVLGNTVHWRGLNQVVQDATGLPESGQFELSPLGDRIIGGSNGLKGKAIHPDTAVARAAEFAHQPDTQAALLGSLAQVEGTGHSLMDLVNMDQFRKDDQGYYDGVQNQSMEDFYQILQYYMPSDLRETFINPNPITLNPTLKGISQMRGTKGEDPESWYKSLAVSYLTGTVANWDNDPASKYLNAVRANKWLRTQASTSDVFKVQGPALYTNRWMTDPSNGSLNDIGWFLSDQRNNSDSYNSLIDADSAAWKEEIQQQVEGTPESIQQLLDQVDSISQYAKDKKLYWAYAMFKYSINPLFLNVLQAISFNPDPNVDGSVFMQRVQRTSAVLNVLDPSNFFDQQFAETIQLFQVSNILPQLIDYSGDLEDYSYAVNAIVQKFIETYIDSPDPAMKEAAEALQQAQEQGYLNDILQVFQQTSVAMGGLFTWGRLINAYQSSCAKFFGNGVPKMAVYGVAMMALTFMIVGFVTGSLKWKDLSAMQQATLIGYGVGISAQLIMMVARRGVAVAAVLDADQGLWQGVRQFFSKELLTNAQQRNLTGFRRWLVEEGGGAWPNQSSMEQAALLAEESALNEEEAELTLTRRIFGRNLDEFVATRFGAITAIFGIIMSIYFLVNADQPLEIAANSLFLAASTLELIATGGGWALSAFGAETAVVGGLAVSTILSVVAVIGVLAMVAGAILLIIFMTQKRPSPVEEFARGKARKAGYYMPYATEIDYFEVFQPQGQDQRSGVTLAANGDASKALFLNLDGSVSIGSEDHTSHSAFYLVVDELGRARFIAPMVDDQGRFATKVLTLKADGSIGAEAPIAPADDTRRQLWYAEMQGPASYSGDHLSAAPFTLCSAFDKEVNGKSTYLSTSGGTVVASGQGLSWTIEMVVTAPAGLMMPDISIYTYNRDVSQGPVLAMPGSEPRSWAVSPALPEFMQLDCATGVLSQKTGVAPAAMAKAGYQLVLSNSVGSVSDSFTLEVLQPSST